MMTALQTIELPVIEYAQNDTILITFLYLLMSYNCKCFAQTYCTIMKVDKTFYHINLKGFNYIT